MSTSDFESNAAQLALNEAIDETAVIANLEFGYQLHVPEHVKHIVIKNCKITCCDSMFRDNKHIESVEFIRCDFTEVKSVAYMFKNCSALNSVKFGNFNGKLLQTMYKMFQNCTAIERVDLSTFKYCENTMASMFYGCCGLRYINFGSINTSNVTDMSNMFCNCKSLVEIDLTYMDTSSVENMSGMFRNCILLNKPILNFETYNVKDMSHMFEDCDNLSSIEQHFDTSNVTNMSHMFDSANLSVADFSSFNTANVTNMDAMFKGCKIEELDISNFNFSSVKTANRMFEGCVYMTSLKLPEVTFDAEGFFGYQNQKSLIGYSNNNNGIVNFNNKQRANKHFIIAGEKTDLIVVDNATLQAEELYEREAPMTAEEFNAYLATLEPEDGAIVIDSQFFNMAGKQMIFKEGTTKVTFKDCTIPNAYRLLAAQDIESVVFEDCDTASVFDCSAMFSGCSNLKEVDMRGFQTDNVIRMSRMFYGCSALKNLDLSTLNTKNVMTMRDMFAGCSNLEKLNIASFVTCSVNDMSGMFSGCISMNIIFFNHFCNKNLIDYDNMFGAGKMAIGIMNHTNGTVAVHASEPLEVMINEHAFPVHKILNDHPWITIVHDDLKNYAINEDEVEMTVTLAAGPYESGAVSNLMLSGEGARYTVNGNLEIVHLEKDDEERYFFTIEIPVPAIEGVTVKAAHKWSGEGIIAYGENTGKYTFEYTKGLKDDAEIYLHYNRNDKTELEDVTVAYILKCNISRFEDKFAIDKDEVVQNVKCAEGYECNTEALQGSNNAYTIPVTIIASNVKKSVMDDAEGYWVSLAVEHVEYAGIDRMYAMKWSDCEETCWKPDDGETVEIDGKKYDCFSYSFDPDHRDRKGLAMIKYSKADGEEDDVVVTYEVTFNVSTYEESFAILDRQVVVDIKTATLTDCAEQPIHKLYSKYELSDVEKEGAHADYVVSATETALDLREHMNAEGKVAYWMGIAIKRMMYENTKVQYACKWECVDKALEWQDFHTMDEYDSFYFAYVEGRGNMEVYYKYTREDHEDVIVCYSIKPVVTFWVEQWTIDAPNLDIDMMKMEDFGIPKLTDLSVQFRGVSVNGSHAHYDVALINIIADMRKFINRQGENGYWISLGIKGQQLENTIISSRKYWIDEQPGEFKPVEEARSYTEDGYDAYEFNYDPNNVVYIDGDVKKFRYAYVEYQYMRENPEEREDFTTVTVRYELLFSVNIKPTPEREELSLEEFKEIMEEETIDGTLYLKNYKIPLFSSLAMPDTTKEIQMYNCELTIVRGVMQMVNDVAMVQITHEGEETRKRSFEDIDEFAVYLTELEVNDCTIVVDNCIIPSFEGFEMPELHGVNCIRFNWCKFEDDRRISYYADRDIYLRSCVASFVKEEYAITEPNTDVVAAPIVDHRLPPTTDMTSEITSVKSSGSGASYTVELTLKSDNLKKHMNSLGKLGYWIGVGIARDSATSARAYFIEECPFLPVDKVRDDEYEKDGTVYDTYYFGYNPENNVPGHIDYRYTKEAHTSVVVHYVINFDIHVADTDFIDINDEELAALVDPDEDVVELQDYNILATKFPEFDGNEIIFRHCKFHHLSHFFENTNAKHITFITCDFSEVEDCDYCFYNCGNLRSVKVEFINSNVKSVEGLFAHCASLKEIEITGCDFSGVETATKLFLDCECLKTLNIHDNNMDTANLTDISYAFRDCKALTKLDLGIFNVSNVTKIGGMLYGCETMEQVAIPATFDRSKLTSCAMVLGSNCTNVIGGGNEVIFVFPRSAYPEEVPDLLGKDEFEYGNGRKLKLPVTVIDYQVSDETVTVVVKDSTK